jgi:hypothetical protein
MCSLESKQARDHDVMGSDWTWELRVPLAAKPALRELYALAAERDLHPQRPDGLINLFNDSAAGPRAVQDSDVALDAMATGNECGQFWTTDEVDVFVGWENGTIYWALDSVFCYRRPVPEADAFRELHARLTDLWLDAAQRLNAEAGRVLDEWSTEQVWHLGIHEAVHPASGWPAELGWWTYLGPALAQSAPPLPEGAARTSLLPNGASLVSLLEDPAAVDPLRYEEIHNQWYQAPKPT